MKSLDILTTIGTVTFDKNSIIFVPLDAEKAEFVSVTKEITSTKTKALNSLCKEILSHSPELFR